MSKSDLESNQESNHKPSLELKRHSLEHVMVLAIRRLFVEDVLLGVGPVIENGFYQDVDYKISEEDFPKIEAEMGKIIAEDLPITRELVDIDEAIQFYKAKGQKYKVELLEDIKSKGTTKMKDEEEADEVKDLTDKGKVSFYTVGIHRDLCRGPHVERTGQLKGMAFKLDRVAGAYWRGNEKNPMLTRVYAVAFEDQKDLEDYYFRLEEAKRRDHRKIGKELDLFIFSDLVGKMPIYTQNGYIVLEEMRKFSQDLNHKIGFREVWTPQMNRGELFKISGHYEKYKEDMMTVHSQYEEEEYFLKPMNCPQHTQVYDSRPRSYKELPIRISDFANLYRDERPGTLNGLLRLRYFRQDDGHSFCREDQVRDEVHNIVSVVKEALDTYGLDDYYVRLSLRGDDKSKYIGDDAIWDRAETAIKEIAEDIKIKYKLGLGEAAIYGPKLDFMTVDALGREWQVSTIQLDFNMPGRFGLKYKDADDSEKTPVMIHRAIVGGIERFFGLLIETYAGAFPAWLAPVQVKLLPINEQLLPEVEKVKAQILELGKAVGLELRVEVDDRAETLQARIRDAANLKVPYTLVIGKRELEAGKVAVRVRGKGDIGAIPTEEFAQKLIAEVKARQLELSLAQVG